jgi:hypothetical protein
MFPPRRIAPDTTGYKRRELIAPEHKSDAVFPVGQIFRSALSCPGWPHPPSQGLGDIPACPRCIAHGFRPPWAIHAGIAALAPVPGLFPSELPSGGENG